jgi:hypothetical protein
MIINRIHEHQKLLSLFLFGLRTYQHPWYVHIACHEHSNRLLSEVRGFSENYVSRAYPLLFG